MIPDHEIARIGHAAVRAYRQACGENVPHEWGADTIEAREAAIEAANLHLENAKARPETADEMIVKAIANVMQQVNKRFHSEPPAPLPAPEPEEPSATAPEAASETGREDG